MQGNRRRDGVDPYTAFGSFQGAATGQGHDPGLGGGVMGLLLLRTPAQYRGVVDDGPGTSALHMREHGAGHAHGAGEGDIQHRGPLFIRHLGQAHLPAKPGVVDQHIDTAQRIFSSCDQGLHVGFDGNVAQLPVDRLQAGFSLEPFDGFFEAARVDIGNHQGAAALFGTALGGGVTDTGAGCGGDQNRLARQQLVAGNIRGCLSHG